jgi:hypothetical protein
MTAMTPLDLAASGADNGLGLTVAALLTIGVLLLVVLFVAALVSILRSPNLSGTGKLLWVVVVFCLQLIGPLAWFLFGRSARLDDAYRGAGSR